MNEVVIVGGVRTASGRFGKSLKDVPATELGKQVLESLMSKIPLEKKDIDEIVFGHGYVHGVGLNVARVASQLAHFPQDVPAYIVMKACGSSLKAITTAASTIAAGQEETMIVGGVESMSNVPYLLKNRWGQKFGHTTAEDALFSDGLECSIIQEHMGITAERLATRYGITREEQDRFAFESHMKAKRALANRKFEEEICPIELTTNKGSFIFQKDESIRTDASLDQLRELESVFKQNGTVTAGNACPMSDGAAALLMMSSEKAKQLSLNPLVKVKAYASAGVDPKIMGIGPVPATRKALKKAGLSLHDIGRIEINEAFAAQALSVMKDLDLNPNIVNVNGGAIALGHPVGATGAKLTTTLIHEMIRENITYGMVTLCMAGGMGLTVIYENMTN
ncbi:acetyl-CoA C-acetyltransferase [Salirhabdus euzebyi]|uniref:acetyl-CoA C-acetyltransferase n=1 Tax=Salirhabdus euzebyi TaxID=394506 RepID=A0A841Q4V2_9BACI|nr:thiolase family protein [Salirhabdus euzebyi]MBB6453372.1 acetyl-CoA C-acetyltransferase [Salirhabdus euzebyi]